MQSVSLYRYPYLIVAALGAMVLAACLLVVGVRTLQPVLFVPALVLAAASVFTLLFLPYLRYDLFGGYTAAWVWYAPVLVSPGTLFSPTSRIEPLDSLMSITVRRSLVWQWCDGAIITLHFTDRAPMNLGLVANATAGLHLLGRSLPLTERLQTHTKYQALVATK